MRVISRARQRAAGTCWDDAQKEPPGGAQAEPATAHLSGRVPAGAAGGFILGRSSYTTGSRVVRQVCDPAPRGLEQSFVGDVVEGAQLQEMLRDRQAEDAAHGDQGAQVCVVAVQ